MKRPYIRYAAVALAAASWGTWPLILRHAEKRGNVDGALESLYVMFVLTAVTGLVMIKDRVQAERSAAHWLGIAWLGFGDAANFVLFFASYRTTSVAIAVLTHYLTPIIVAIAAPFALEEKATWRSWAAVAVSFAGLVVLLQPWQATRRPGDLLGALLGAGSAVFYASNVIMNKRLSRVFSSSQLMFFHGLVAIPLLAALVPRSAYAAIDLRAIGLLTLGALGPGALAGLLFVWGLRKLPSAQVSTLTLLEPLVAVLVGAAALGEPLGIGSVAGGLMILAGALLVILTPRPSIG